MIKTKMTAAAASLAQKAHAGQVDRAGEPYINHPLAVAEQMDTEEETCVALLHDVLEDSDFTADDLRAIGMTEEIVQAVELLTHDPEVDYFVYIEGIRPNPLAVKVKLADLAHNADLSRLEVVTGYDRRRQSKYFKAVDVLEGRVDADEAWNGKSSIPGSATARAHAGRQMPPAPQPPHRPGA